MTIKSNNTHAYVLTEAILGANRDERRDNHGHKKPPSIGEKTSLDESNRAISVDERSTHTDLTASASHGEGKQFETRVIEKNESQ